MSQGIEMGSTVESRSLGGGGLLVRGLQWQPSPESSSISKHASPRDSAWRSRIVANPHTVGRRAFTIPLSSMGISVLCMWSLVLGRDMEHQELFPLPDRNTSHLNRELHVLSGLRKQSKSEA